MFLLAKHRECGGLLEGENGKFDYSQEAKGDDQNWGKCVWLVQAYGATQIQFTLDEFLPVGSDETVILYPDRIPGQIDLTPTSLANEINVNPINSRRILILSRLPSQVEYAERRVDLEISGQHSYRNPPAAQLILVIQLGLDHT